MIRKLKNLIRRFIFRFIKPEVRYINSNVAAQASYSQAGEDMILDFLQKSSGVHVLSYLDLGAFSPVSANNTYRMYLNGARGVLVEADITRIELIKSKRPEDKVINIGVGLNDGEILEFFIYDMPALNTFSENEVKLRDMFGTHKVKEVVSVETKSINSIIKENFAPFPDFMSIDIEGIDYAILNDLNYDKYPIPIICAETCDYSDSHKKVQRKEIQELLITKGYFIYANTYINTIFVREDWFNAI